MLTNRKAWAVALVLTVAAATSTTPNGDDQPLPCGPSMAVLDTNIDDHAGAHHYTPQEQQWLEQRVSELLSQNYDAAGAALVAELEIHSTDNSWGFFHMIRNMKNVFSPNALFKRDNETTLTAFGGGFFTFSTPLTPSFDFTNFGRLTESTSTTSSTRATPSPLELLNGGDSTSATPGQISLQTTTSSTSELTFSQSTLEPTTTSTSEFSSPSTLLFPETTSSTEEFTSLLTEPTTSETSSLRTQDTTSSLEETTSSSLTRTLSSSSRTNDTPLSTTESTTELTAESSLTSTGADLSSDRTTLLALETTSDDPLRTTLDDTLATLDFVSRVVTTLLGLVVTVTLTYLLAPSSASTGDGKKEKLGGGLSESNRIVVGVVVGVGGALIIGVIALLFYLRKRRHQEHELGKWTFWKKEGKGTDEFLTGELGVRDRNINQGSNF